MKSFHFVQVGRAIDDAFSRAGIDKLASSNINVRVYLALYGSMYIDVQAFTRLQIFYLDEQP